MYVWADLPTHLFPLLWFEQRWEDREEYLGGIFNFFGFSFSSLFMGFPGGSDGKESACNAGDPGSLLGWEDLLEEGMATHSSTLAWRIPWTEEPGRL